MGFWSSIVGAIGVIAAPFTGGASLLLTAAAVVAPKVVDKVVDFVMKPFMGAMGIPGVDMSAAQEAERQQGVLIQRQGSVNNIPVVYGYRKVGDIVTFAETGATDNKYLWVAHVLSEGTVAGLRNIYIDDNLIPESFVTKLNNGEIVNIDSGKYSGRVKLQFFRGVYWTDPTPANHPVRASCFFNTDTDRPPSWTSDMVYNGLAVIFARYEWKKITTQAEQDANPFGYNIPSLSVEMYGKLLSPVPSSAPANEYDGDTARYEIITTGSGQTIGYTNPVEVLLDYLRNPRYGKGLKNADIDWASWNIAATKCKTEVTYASGIKGPILSMNFVLDTSQTIFNNTKTLLSNFRGYMPYVQGKYKLKIEDAGHPTDILSGSAEIVAEFDKNQIIGDIVWTGIEKTSKYNQVVVTYVDPDNKWSNQEVVYPETEAERQVYINQDNGRENKGVFTASGITNPIMAKDLARILFWKSRLSDSVSLTVSSQGLELEPGDCIHVAGNFLTFNTTYPWRVISSTLNNDMTVTLGCVYNPDSIFPYTRWGEPDTVLPVYIPKGAERYYPKITPSEKNGLLPPYPGKPSSGTVTTSSGLSDIVEITKVKFVALDNKTIETSSLIYADVYFTQPNNTLYFSTKFYWKEDVASASAWQENEIQIQSGAGSEIIARLGPFTFGKDYLLNTRVIYQSNQASSKTGVYKFKVQGETAVVTPPPGTPTTPVTPSTNTAENFFSSVTAVTLLDGTYPNLVPKEPRQIQVTLKQDMTAGPNQYLDSLEIFWKPSANPKWYYSKGTRTDNQGVDIIFNMSLGSRLYPLRPGYNNEAPATADNYDFIFRFAYSDGKVSKYQWHATNVSIEWNGITWGPFNPFALTGMGTVIVPKELSADYVPQIAGPNDIVETRNIKISQPYSVRDNGNVTLSTPVAARFFFYPPVDADRANWRGVRVYRHKAGVAGAGDYVDFIPATSSGGLWSFLVTNITYDDVWEYVLVPLVTYGDSTVEANFGQYVKGKLHNRGADADYPGDANWAPSWTFDAIEELSTAKAKIGSATATPPRQDTFIASFDSATMLNAGVPSSPRKLSFTFTQSISNGSNGHIVAYAIYYKQSDATYWKRSQYNLSGYTEGTLVTFNTTQTTPQMDVGYPSYPTFPGREQYYDFVIRFVYDNGSESTYESHFLNKPIENTGITSSPIYSFGFLGYSSGVTAPRRSSTVLTTEDKAPPGAVVDVRNILTSTSMYPIALEVMDPPTTGNNLRFGFAIPIATLKSYLAGFRILRREVIGGLTTEYTTDDSNIPYKTGQAYVNNAYVDILSAWSKDTVWHKEYEWAVIPLVWYQGVKTEANNAVYWRGKVCDSYNSLASNPWVSNWYSKNSAQVLSTAVIRNKLAEAFPDTAPYARPQSIKRINPNYATLGDAGGYWSITYTVPTNFVSATVYRRQVHDPNDSSYGTAGSYAGKFNFTGAGQWEKIEINNTNNPLTNNGTSLSQTINLRPAIGDYFNDGAQYGYDVRVAKSTVNAQGGNVLYKGYSASRPTQGSSITSNLSPYIKYWLQGNKGVIAGDLGSITQIFIVITTNISGTNTLSTMGMRIDLYNKKYINGAWVTNADGNVITDALAVSTVDMEASMDISKLDFTNSGVVNGNIVHPSWTTLYRKMSDALAVIPDSSIVQPGSTSWVTAYTKPTATPGVQ